MVSITMNDLLLLMITENIIAIIGVFIYVLLSKRWRVSCIILRFTGDKRRPQVVFRKARIDHRGNTSRLIIKGYPTPLHDFKREYYYPGEKTGGALILWEFKRGWLTPAIPALKKLDPTDQEEVKKAINTIIEKRVVDFDFSQELYDALILKSIDDVDAEWNLQEHNRVNTLYTSGWRDFLAKYGSHIAIVIIALFLLVGWIVWIKESPNWMGQCIGAGVEAAKNTYLKEVAGKVATSTIVPGG